VAEKGQVVIRPMMYLALSYDHRVVDGKEAVTFLIRVNDCIQNPMQLLLALERRQDDG
jgi:2-oxoglutarate dehydrogenase E2 component (dihydrolipoamide succinyltransferase)